jgi:hypothetical protein
MRLWKQRKREIAMADKQYKVIIEGEDGRGSQVFEAETPEELQNQFKEAQTHATKKIAEQDKELQAARERLAALEANIEPAPAGNGGTDTAWRKQFFKEGLTEIFGAPIDDVIRDYGRISQTTEQIRLNALGNSLLQQCPEIAGTSEADQIENGKKIAKFVEENGMPMTLEGLKAATVLLEREGKLKVAPLENSEILPPVPTTITRPSVQVNTDQSEKEFLRTAPTEEVRKYLEKKFAAKQV